MIYYSLKILNHINGAVKLVDSQFFSGYNSSIYNVLFQTFARFFLCIAPTFYFCVIFQEEILCSAFQERKLRDKPSSDGIT